MRRLGIEKGYVLSPDISTTTKYTGASKFFIGGVIVYSEQSGRALFDIEVLRQLGYESTSDRGRRSKATRSRNK